MSRRGGACAPGSRKASWRRLAARLLLGLPWALGVACNSLTGLNDLEVVDCTPGVLQRCSGPAGCSGARVCDQNGLGFSECDCNRASAASVDGESESEVQAPLTPVSTSSARVGTSCRQDTDCASGLTCITNDAAGGPFAGGIQNGYCTRRCAADAECSEIDPLGRCIQPGAATEFYCVALCTPELPTYPDQCGGRADMACFTSGLDGGGMISFCIPACHSDRDCGGGQVCDLLKGVCGLAAGVTRPEIGAACDTLCVADVCTSSCTLEACASIRGQTRACTGFCTPGSVAGCGYSADASPREAGCLDTDPVSGLGLCTELCNVSSDCALAALGWGCSPIQDTAFAAALGRPGFCEQQGPRACSNICATANNGACDDGGTSSDYSGCSLGTDCADCGAR